VDLSFRHDWWFARLPASPTDAGRVLGCVVRPERDRRLTPDAIRVDPQTGIEGDYWARDPKRTPEDQISLINVHVLRSIGAHDAAKMALSGDNLQVDLDLSEANLPVGTRLVVGEAVLEISPKPHRPCRSFHARFGASAAQRVARANRRGRRGRGVLARIVQGGSIRVGDAIRVERPARA
jgi:hypothetical protein